jgi:hypothetical protein
MGREWKWWALETELKTWNGESPQCLVAIYICGSVVFLYIATAILDLVPSRQIVEVCRPYCFTNVSVGRYLKHDKATVAHDFGASSIKVGFVFFGRCFDDAFMAAAMAGACRSGRGETHR